MSEPTAPRLTVELVPRTCWLSNVRTLLSRLEWDTLRRLVYVRAGYQCEVCGGRGDRHPASATSAGPTTQTAGCSGWWRSWRCARRATRSSTSGWLSAMTAAARPLST